MSKPVLTYFQGRGRAEAARLIFAEVGVEYEDRRITDIKPLKEEGKLPFGQVPILEIDGVTIAQSYTIFRFLARRYGLYGSTDIDGAFADMVVDQNIDIANGISTAKTVEEKRAVLTKLQFLENILKKNKVGDEEVYFVKGKFTYADIVICNRWYSLSTDFADAMGGYELLKKHFECVSNRPGIKKWMNERPVTKM